MLALLLVVACLHPLSQTDLGATVLSSSGERVFSLQETFLDRSHDDGDDEAGNDEDRSRGHSAVARANQRAEQIASAPPVTDPADASETAPEDGTAPFEVTPSDDATLPAPGGGTPDTVTEEVGSAPQTTTPSHAGVPVGRNVVFVGDYETGAPDQWKTCQSRSFNGSCPGEAGFYGMQVLGGGLQRQGDYAARFEVRDGDVPTFGGGERAEVSMNDAARVYEGDERWYEFSLKFDPSFSNPTSSFFIVMQWHSGNGSPPVALMVNRAGELQLTNNATNDATRTIGAVRRGEWVDYVLHVKFSKSASEGWAEVHQNGDLVVPRHNRATMSSDSCYLKQGIYRSSSETSTAVVWQDGMRVTAP